MILENFKPRYFKQISLVLTYDGKTILDSQPIYINNNRYFVPLIEFINDIGGKINIIGSSCYISIKKNEVIILELETIKLSYFNNKLYVALFDIVNSLDFHTYWDYKQNNIRIAKLLKKKVVPKIVRSKRNVLVTLEDFTDGKNYDSGDALFKVRIVMDYLNDRGIPFHLSWIPRYIDPLMGIDNNLCNDQNIKNADFIYTLDFCLSRKGIIGLHGYTHQHDGEISGQGTEFNDVINNEENIIKYRIESAINISKKLEIPCRYFETPHHAANTLQQSIFERYFDYMYEPYVGIVGDKVIRSPRNKKTLYIPISFDYVKENKIEDMLKYIDNLSENTIGNFFYHVNKEFDFIKYQTSNEFISIDYNNNSFLKKVLNKFEENSIKVISIYDVNEGDLLN
ncbi:hypothetical protein CPJCM30710_01020 [Clostridium polyendosporum]|uniref:DUF2334 domain-containing protein n=1 Tax=Clostridium polyendosporum TaxID=69208 RepID=A0A919VFF0_9CLOT|nr:DUF2334 domain-containing protein [Clostridium polyendosporum]GIM27436.1 hypothetical protein CPJCM30710_01020 [Clostridium polyendosporum]